ncbi:MAG: biotin carboxyl carrier protein, partial [Candidatus Binatia bacterium]
VGERYKEVTDQVIHYALGRWGKEGASSMDPNVKDKILSRARAKELAGREPPEASIKEVRLKLGGAGVSDEELLLRWLLNSEEIDAMRAAGPAKEYLSVRQPLVALIEELTKRTDCNRIQVQKPGLSITLERKGSMQ